MTEQPLRKTCTTCQLPKPVADYYKQPNGRFGLASQCKPCMAAQRKDARLSDPERAKRLSHERYIKRRAKHHEETKRWRRENPARDKANRRAYYDKNRDRHAILAKAHRQAHIDHIKAKSAQWYEANKARLKLARMAYRERTKERIKARNQAYYRKNKRKYLLDWHKRRARKRNAGGSYVQRDIDAMLKKQKAKCVYCPKPLSFGYHIDHIMPLARGGNNSARNLQLLCPKCNLSKGAKEPIVFMREQGFPV